MLKVVYGRKGKAISDFEVEDWVDYCIETFLNKGYYETINTSNELVLLTFALRVLEGVIPISDIKFYYEDEEMEFDETLGLQNPTDKSFSIFSSIVERSLNQSSLMLKARKKECCKT